MQNEAAQAKPQGDEEALRRAQPSLHEQIERLEREHRARLRAEGEQAIDRVVLDLEEQIHAVQEDADKVLALRRRQAERMGIAAPSTSRGASSGFVRREGQIVAVHGVFSDPVENLPGFVRWLCDQGCFDLYYEFPVDGEN